MTDDLVPFYERRGFIALSDKPRHLLMPMNRIRALFPGEAQGMQDIVSMIREAAAAAQALEDLSTPEVSEHALTLIEELHHRLDTLLEQAHNPR